MDIIPFSDGSVKILLTVSDTQRLGISFESFAEDDPETLTFLSYILAALGESGMLHAKEDSQVSARVFERTDGGMMILLSPDQGPQLEKPFTVIALRQRDPSEFFNSVPTVVKAAKEHISSAGLYQLGEGYAIVIDLDLSPKAARKRLPYIPGLTYSRIKAEKIREYGNLLSNSPIDLFI